MRPANNFFFSKLCQKNCLLIICNGKKIPSFFIKTKMLALAIVSEWEMRIGVFFSLGHSSAVLQFGKPLTEQILQ